MGGKARSGIIWGDVMLHSPRIPGLAEDPHRLRPNLHKGAGPRLHEFQDGHIFRQTNGSPEVPLLGTKHSARRPTTGLPRGATASANAPCVEMFARRLGTVGRIPLWHGEEILLRQESGPTCVPRGIPRFAVA